MRFMMNQGILRTMIGISGKIPSRLVCSLQNTVSLQLELKQVRCLSTSRDIKQIVSGNHTVNSTLHSESVTNRELITTDTGLSNFIKRTYWYTGASIAGSLGLASALSQTEMVVSHPGICLTAAIIGGFGGIMGIAKGGFTVQKDVYTKNTNQMITVYSSMNSPLRLMSYGIFLSGMSVSLVPLFYVYPTAIMPALVASSTVFASASLYAYARPVNSLSVWGPTLATGITSLLGIGLVGIGSDFILGPTSTFSMLLHSADIYLGIPLFTGFIAYDTHKAIEMYRNEMPDHLGCSVNLYLDFVNIFVLFVQLIGQRNGDK